MAHMKRDDYLRLIAEVEARSTNMHSDDHGPQHWRCVALTGIRLASMNRSASAKVALLFGIFHDAMRENDHQDDGHGNRGAELARTLYQEGFWSFPGGYDAAVYKACETHTDVTHTPSDIIGVCYDADRLNLWRVGIQPNPHYLNTAEAKKLVFATRDLHDTPLTWEQVLDEFEQCYNRDYEFNW